MAGSSGAVSPLADLVCVHVCIFLMYRIQEQARQRRRRPRHRHYHQRVERRGQSFKALFVSCLGCRSDFAQHRLSRQTASVLAAL